MSEPAIELFQVTKEFTRGDGAVRAVDGISLTVHQGEFVSFVGKSGSGKSTVLHLMSGLLRPTHGTVRFEGLDLASLSDDRRTLLRRDRIGFIFQFFNLLPTLTAEENVALPLLLARINGRDSKSRVQELLRLVRLGDRAESIPSRLSGGEMQRVAIARALVNRPAVLFGDEPTGNLDSVSGEAVLAFLKEMQTDQGLTVVLVTHDLKAAAYGDRIITLRDGRVLEDLPTRSVAP